MPYFSHILPTPLGPLTIVVNDAEELVALSFRGKIDLKPVTADAGKTREAARQLTEYFAGKRRAFDLKMNPAGTAFQKQVWRELAKIPHGKTRSYGEIAAALGKPGASRAVGTANGANPIPVVVPCHRVINASGALGGYSGGLGIKEKLLALEGARMV